MRIARNGRKAGKPEIEHGDPVSQTLDPGEYKSPQAAVHMEPDAVFECYLREAGQRVDEAIGIISCACDYGDGIAVYQFFHFVRYDPEIRIGHGREHHLDVEIITGLVKRRVRRHGKDHLGFCYVVFSAGPVAVDFHCHHDAFTSAEGDAAAYLVTGVYCLYRVRVEDRKSTRLLQSRLH